MIEYLNSALKSTIQCTALRVELMLPLSEEVLENVTFRFVKKSETIFI